MASLISGGLDMVLSKEWSYNRRLKSGQVDS